MSRVPPASGRWSRSFYKDLLPANPATKNPAASLDITHVKGFPALGATQADFNAKSDAIKKLDIRWGTVDNQRARLILVEKSGNIIELLDTGNGHYLSWPYTTTLSNYINILLENTPHGTHVGVYAFNAYGIEEIMPFRRITTKAEQTSFPNSMPKVQYKSQVSLNLNTKLSAIGYNYGKNIDLYDILSGAIAGGYKGQLPGLQEYMDSTDGGKKELPLGDIIVLAAQPPSDFAQYSTVQLEALAQKSREYFIPITFETFNLKNVEEYRYLSKGTGGKSRKGAIAANPEQITVINNAIWRAMQEDPYLLLNPWDGYLNLLYVNRAGDAFSSASVAKASNTNDSPLRSGSIMWSPLESNSVTGKIKTSSEKDKLRKTDIICSNRILGPSFYLDSFLSGFFVMLNISNPYNLDLECVLINPDGEEVPIDFSGSYGLKTYINAYTPLDSFSKRAGAWRIACIGAKYNEAEFSYYIVGESKGLYPPSTYNEDYIINIGKQRVRKMGDDEYKGAIAHFIKAVDAPANIFNAAENGGRLRFECVTYQGYERLTSLDLSIKVTYPSMSFWGTALRPRDDGVYPDLIAGDGIYTAELNCGGELGHYQVTSTVNNSSGTAHVTRLMRSFPVPASFDLDSTSPFWGAPITENFQRMAQTTFDVIYDAGTAREPDPEFQHVTFPIVNIGNIKGPQEILAGIETEYSVDITPDGLVEPLSDYFSWSCPDGSQATIFPDPDGRPNVVTVRSDRPAWSYQTPLQISNTVPRALTKLIDAQTRTLRLTTAAPRYVGKGFNANMHTVFDNEEIFFEGALVLPEGYNSKASWSKKGSEQVATLVKQDATGCTIRTFKSGMLTLTLSSDIYPDKIGTTFTVKVIHREGSGNQPEQPGDDSGTKPNPIPGQDDPGGDDDVNPNPENGSGNGGGDNGGGGSPSNPGTPTDPETPDPEDAKPLPPGISGISVDGGALGSTGTASVRGLRGIPVVFDFESIVERYTVFALRLTESGQWSEAEATISNVRLTTDGLKLTAEFHPKGEGEYRIVYSFERKGGVKTTGDFVIDVTKDGSASEDPSESEEHGVGGGGCNVGIGFALGTGVGLLYLKRRHR